MSAMTDIEILMAIEEIKRVKARYFHGLDHKDWDGWRRDVWAPDAELHVPEALTEPVVGIEAIIAYVVEGTAGMQTVHHGHMPDIEILSPTEATGVWAMEDRLWRAPGDPSPQGGYTRLHGFGHYRETYRRCPTGWRLQTTRLTRLRIEHVSVF